MQVGVSRIDQDPPQEMIAPRQAAVLGHPISHTLSPTLHLAAYRAMGLPWSYRAIDVNEAQLPEFIAGLDESWAGLSLTMPLKRAILPLLDAVDPVAESIQAANTVVFSQGERLGFNTDVAGIITALREAGFDQFPGDVAILGAGATAMSAVVSIADQRPSRVVISTRRPEAAEEVARFADGLGLNAQTWPWESAADLLACQVVISTLPGDAAAHLADAVPADPGLLMDVTYSPWPTALAAAWHGADGAIAPGYRMLLWQAAMQVELMTGHQPSVDAMWSALESALPGHRHS